MAAALALLLAACSAGGEDSQPAAPHAGSEPARAAATNASWLTYHANPQRTGVDTSSPARGTVHGAWTSAALDGAIYAEPLIRGGRVYVATENDSVYALNASNGNVIWRTHVGTPVPGSALPCGNIDPSGITGTPVIHARNNTLYAIAFVQPGKHQLVAINTATGHLKWRRNADPGGADPKIHQQRGALVVANGRVYWPYGGLEGDCGDYHGRVASRRLNGAGMIQYRVPSHREAGIWATSGVAVDRHGRLFVATGNGDSTGSFDFGNAVIKLSAGLRKLDFWAPSNWKSLNSGDVDLGSIGPSVLPNGLLFQGGKDGYGRLLRDGHLGHIGAAAYQRPVCGSMWGGTAYANGRVFVPCSDGLVALRIRPGPKFTIAWHATGFFAGPPIVAGGAVWSVDIDSGQLYAFNPATGHRLLTKSVGSVEHFTTPSSGGGQLYVAATDRVVAFAGV